MINEINSLRKEVEEIKTRNKRVELDKAWETSLFRKLLVAGLTYTLMVITMIIIKVEDPFASAVIPTFGFLLSNLSVGWIKKWWINKS